MRSTTARDLPGRCARCFLKTAYCLCAELRPVSSRVEVLIVRHKNEYWKTTGTARLAALANSNVRLVEYVDPLSGPVVEALLKPGARVVFPSNLGAPEGAELAKVEQIVIIDGTWKEARRIMRKVAALQRLPRLTLKGEVADKLRLREGHEATGRSTVEAAAEALRLLGEGAVAHSMELVHADHVGRVLSGRGNLKQKQALLESRHGETAGHG